MKDQLLYKILLAFLLLPACNFAQQTPAEADITGLWKGILYNDSLKNYIPFQIAISEENGKLTGYSYILFDSAGVKETGIKRIKVKRKENRLSIEDIEFVWHNYRTPPPRRVRFRSELDISVADTMMQMKGTWSTNRTTEFSPNAGTLQLQHAINFAPEALFTELVRLKLAQDLSFVKTPRKPQADIAKTADVPVDNKKPVAPLAAADPDKAKEPVPVAPPDNQPVVAQAAPVEAVPAPAPKLLLNNLSVIKNKPSAELAKNTGDRRRLIVPFTPQRKALMLPARDARKDAYLAANKPAPVVQPVAEKPAPVVAAKAPAKPAVTAPPQKPAVAEQPKTIAPPVVINKTTAPAKPPATTTPAPAIVAAPKKETPVTKPDPQASTAAVNVAERTIKSEQSVFFESDSLMLTLYDNGEVDGDTVSVLMNGQILFARQGLSTKANSKTVYIDKGLDSLSMIMYAENLGSIPPNTGLLIIMDGEKRYEVRFSADLKTNAAILLRRKVK